MNRVKTEKKEHGKTKSMDMDVPAGSREPVLRQLLEIERGRAYGEQDVALILRQVLSFLVQGLGEPTRAIQHMIGLLRGLANVGEWNGVFHSSEEMLKALMPQERAEVARMLAEKFQLPSSSNDDERAAREVALAEQHHARAPSPQTLGKLEQALRQRLQQVTRAKRYPDWYYQLEEISSTAAQSPDVVNLLQFACALERRFTKPDKLEMFSARWKIFTLLTSAERPGGALDHAALQRELDGLYHAFPLPRMPKVEIAVLHSFNDGVAGAMQKRLGGFRCAISQCATTSISPASLVFVAFQCAGRMGEQMEHGAVLGPIRERAGPGAVIVLLAVHMGLHAGSVGDVYANAKEQEQFPVINFWAKPQMGGLNIEDAKNDESVQRMKKFISDNMGTLPSVSL